MERREFTVGASTVSLVIGDITSSDCEVLVSSDNRGLTMGVGVSQALNLASGGQALLDATKLVPRQSGDVVVTSAGSHPAKYIFHAVTTGSLDYAMIVRSVVRKALELLTALSCDSIAFPAVGTGGARLPREVVATQMAETLFTMLDETPRPLRVEIYLYPTASAHGDAQALDFVEMFTRQRLALLSPFFQSREGAVTAGTPTRMDEIQLMLKRLDARRATLEEELLLLLTHEVDDASRIESLQRQLSQVQLLRTTYETEASQPRQKQTGVVPNSVFVSSTSKDLASHRAAVKTVIERLGRIYVGMEEFPPETSAPAEMITRRVEESQLYLGILGLRYGYVDESTGLSMTELEYQRAVATGKDLSIFVMDEDAPVRGSMVERNPDSLAKLNNFRERVLRHHSCGIFIDESDLAAQVARSINGD